MWLKLKLGLSITPIVDAGGQVQIQFHALPT